MDNEMDFDDSLNHPIDLTAVAAQSGPAPRFTHDCDACQFKGQYGRFDVWFCARCDWGTWIARYGSDGCEYASYPTFVLDQLRDRKYQSDESVAAILDAARGWG